MRVVGLHQYRNSVMKDPQKKNAKKKKGI